MRVQLSLSNVALSAGRGTNFDMRWVKVVFFGGWLSCLLLVEMEDNDEAGLTER